MFIYFGCRFISDLSLLCIALHLLSNHPAAGRNHKDARDLIYILYVWSNISINLKFFVRTKYRGLE